MPNEDVADIPAGSRDVVHPQPLAQAEREVFAGEDPSAWWQRTVEAAALYRLLRHGWHWGPAGRQARRDQLFRPFGAEE
jgi:hypothetical protein